MGRGTVRAEKVQLEVTADFQLIDVGGLALKAVSLEMNIHLKDF